MYKKSSPTAAIAVTGGVALLSHSCHNAIMLEPESPELDSITLLTKHHLQPPGMLTNLHSLPSLQGIVGTGVCTVPPLLEAAPSCRYLKQGGQFTVVCRDFGDALVSLLSFVQVDLQPSNLQPQGRLRNLQLGPSLQGMFLGVSFKLDS